MQRSSSITLVLIGEFGLIFDFFSLTANFFNRYNSEIYRVLTRLYLSWLLGRELSKHPKLSPEEFKKAESSDRFKEFRTILRKLTRVDDVPTVGGGGGGSDYDQSGNGGGKSNTGNRDSVSGASRWVPQNTRKYPAAFCPC